MEQKPKMRFTNKVVTKYVKDKYGRTIIETVETEIKSASSVKKNRILMLNQLGKIADEYKASPYLLNHIGWIVKELKRPYNSRKWYIPFTGVTGCYEKSAKTTAYGIKVIMYVYSNETLKLSDESKKRLEELLKEQSWCFITTYPKDVNLIPEDLFKYLISTPRNKATYEECLKKSNEMQPEVSRMTLEAFFMSGYMFICLFYGIILCHSRTILRHFASG